MWCSSRGLECLVLICWGACQGALGCAERTGPHGDPNAEAERGTAGSDTSTGGETSPDTSTDRATEPIPDTAPTDSDGDTGDGGYDYREPVYPEVTEDGGSGNITTYGDVTTPAPSTGGACNYGATGILSFAAINVNVAPLDGAGHWNGGRICGQCAEVRAETAAGIRSTVVRIVDKCPDEYCGIDLGGLPARQLMGSQPGRYDGTWEFVPCEGHAEVSDGPPAVFIKEGSSAYWAIFQVRNPPAAVRSARWSADAGSGTFEWATEAENFFFVPTAILSRDDRVTLTFEYDFGRTGTVTLPGSALGVPEAVYPIDD